MSQNGVKIVKTEHYTNVSSKAKNRFETINMLKEQLLDYDEVVIDKRNSKPTIILSGKGSSSSKKDDLATTLIISAFWTQAFFTMKQYDNFY